MKIKLLNAGRIPPALEARLRDTYEVLQLPQEADADSFFRTYQSSITAVVTSAAIGVRNSVLDKLPNLKVISSFGVGLDKVDVDYAKARGIAVGYTPDVLNDCVADIAFGLMLDVGRSMSSADRYVRAKKWPQGPFPLGFRVSGAKLGIVGMGRIGKTIAKRSIGFEMDVRYHSRNPANNVTWKHEKSLLELAKWADFLVVITAGGAQTCHLINANVLAALGPDGYLINVSRGTVIDESALIEALETNRIAGAGLDVFEDEPNVPERLMNLDNVVLLPHIASATKQTRQAMADRVFDNLKQFFVDGTLLSSAYK
jgi:lactate dehydrogenase-like 2-hydroxyacid dehydrogenase